MDYHLSYQDRLDLFHALILRFRMGEIGPLVFRLEATRLRIDDADINAARDTYIDECAAAINVRGSLPFASGLRKC